MLVYRPDTLAGLRIFEYSRVKDVLGVRQNGESLPRSFATIIYYINSINLLSFFVWSRGPYNTPVPPNEEVQDAAQTYVVSDRLQ